MIRLDLATDDFIGARSQQQDAAAARGFGTGGGAILILGDGLGGHTGGAEASRIVVETFREAADAGAFDEETKRHPALRDALERANARIANGVDPAHGQRGMASTAVAATLANGRLNWVSVGDSHLYLWRAGAMRKLNADHSQAGLMVQSGQYQPDDPEVQAVKSVLVSALTGRRLEIVDHPTQAVEVVPGDIVLLASDGLNTLAEPDIERLLTQISDRGAREISAALLDSVRERRADRQDNTAVVVARIVELQTVASVVDADDIGPPTEAAPSFPKDGSAKLQPLAELDDGLPLTQRATEIPKEQRLQPTPSAPQARPAAVPQVVQRPAAPAQAATGATPPARSAAGPDKGGKIDPHLKNPHALTAAQKKPLDDTGTIPLTRPSRPTPRAKTTGGPPVGLLAMLALALGVAAAAIYFWQMVDTGSSGTRNSSPAQSTATEAKRSGEAVTPATTAPATPASATPARQGPPATTAPVAPTGTPPARPGPQVPPTGGEQAPATPPRSSAAPLDRATLSPGANGTPGGTPGGARQSVEPATPGALPQSREPAPNGTEPRPASRPPASQKGTSVAPAQQQQQPATQEEQLVEQPQPAPVPPAPSRASQQPFQTTTTPPPQKNARQLQREREQQQQQQQQFQFQR